MIFFFFVFLSSKYLWGPFSPPLFLFVCVVVLLLRAQPHRPLVQADIATIPFSFSKSVLQGRPGVGM